ncbi:MAG TPA: phosphodiester glycosidase family protein [Solirubrobacteraceae bacterium]|nr:phosphodiester glycosidase family protein [Solirubrobacteraceae bacterium]
MRRVALLATAIALVPVVVSYVGALTQPSNSSLGVRTVEWLRDNGARGIVNRVENFYYSMTAPATGGPGLHGLPQQAGVAVAGSPHARRRHAAYRPRPLRPIIHPALRGEGVWHATFAPGRGRPPVLITSFRPDPAYPRIVAGVAWIDHTRTSTWLYPGRSEPAVPMPSRGPLEVPPAKRSTLVATFNSGFKLADSAGGYADGGHTYTPLRSGAATFVRYRDGRVDILGWSAGATASPDVTYARQNLPLIVTRGAPNPNLSDGPAWGATLGNAVHVWRSAVGVDRRGNLIYGAADTQTVHSMAQIMIHAGAVRAMELDINAYWPSFITYRTPGARSPANLLPGMQRSPFRYLTPDDRDFFAVYIR